MHAAHSTQIETLQDGDHAIAQLLAGYLQLDVNRWIRQLAFDQR